MSWLTAIGTAIVGFFSALPKIIDEISRWRDSQNIKHEQEVAKKIDETTKETKDANTEEQRKKVANRWADIIRNFNR
jgi:phosphoribosyl-ATP pyrophosphohydrolase